MFRRRQRLFVEMEQMASRPFSQVHKLLWSFYFYFFFCSLKNFFYQSYIHLIIQHISSLLRLFHPLNFLYVHNHSLKKLWIIQVLVEIDSKDREYNEITPVADTNNTISTNVTKKRKKDSPSPIALEPCAGNKAAVLSLLVRMPTGKFWKLKRKSLFSFHCHANSFSLE